MPKIYQKCMIAQDVETIAKSASSKTSHHTNVLFALNTFLFTIAICLSSYICVIVINLLVLTIVCLFALHIALLCLLPSSQCILWCPTPPSMLQ